MKFQKTILAASLAVAAVAANAAIDNSYLKNANPTQRTEGLNQPLTTKNPFTTDVNGNVIKPVLGSSATNIQDLGSNAVVGSTTVGYNEKFEIFNYKTESGREVVSLSKLNADGTKTPQGYFTIVQDGANGSMLVAYDTANDNVDLSTLSDGGQVSRDIPAGTATGYEVKNLNSEHLLYGYQGETAASGILLEGSYTDPNGVSKPFAGRVSGSNTVDIKYVNNGIIGNTGLYTTTGAPVDVSKNIYGVSARDGNNFVAMTGNGIALADLSLGTLQYDGSIVTGDRAVTGTQSQQIQKTRQYNVNGRTVVEVYNDDAGQTSASKYYYANDLGNSNVTLTAATDVNASTLAGLTPIRSGTATYLKGTYETEKLHNTITNKKVTYGETVSTYDRDGVQAGITTSGNSTIVAKGDLGNTNAVEKSSTSVSTGIIKTDTDGNNVYGLVAQKTNTDAEGKKTTAKTEITADYVDSGDFRINGVSIVDNIKTSVDGAVAGATEAIDAKVAQVDEKIVEVDARLTQFNGQATAINSRVDQLNKRVDDVEKTAYRGVAISLAAQQAIPNIGAGQTAVFGGVGHYESESAFALGLATVLKDGRTSFSGALGVAGGSEVGGRLGVAYVFGGK